MKNTSETKIVSFVMMLLWSGFCSSLEMQFKPPEIGVDAIFKVSLLRNIPSSCISISVKNATVVVEKYLVEEMAKAHGEEWKTETERLKIIAGDRARELLKVAKTPSENGGCYQAKIGDMPESIFTLLSFLASGRAVVLNRENKPVSHIYVRYENSKEFPYGDILVSFEPDGDPIATFPWWIS